MTFRDLIEGLAGRRARREEDEVLHPRWRVVAVAAARAPRRAARHGPRHRARRRCSAPGRSWCSTRPSTRCSSRGASPSSSRTSRAASARRAARVRAGSRRCCTGWPTARARRRPRPAARLRQQHRARASWPPGQTTICQLGPSTMSPTVSLDRWFGDEIRADAPETSSAQSAAVRGASGMSTDAVPMSQWPSEHRYTIPVAPGPDVVTVTIDGNEVQAARRAADQGRAGARHLHPALLLARAHEAGRHVPHVPGRGRGHARPADLVRDAGRRRHGRAHAERQVKRPRTACSSSS